MREFQFCPRCAAAMLPSVAEPKTRPTCSARCGFVQYDNPTPVVAAVIEHEGRVLLARNRAWPETWYALVAGFLERDESPEQAILREVKEEVGLDATAAELIGLYPFSRFNQIIIAYHVATSGPISLNHELVDYRLIEPAQCGAWRAGTGLALQAWLRRRGFEPVMTDLPG
jgi:NAD+ diphosphatase